MQNNYDIISKTKLFFSPVKETQWLNSMAENGLFLESRSFMNYKFSSSTARPNKYVYSVRYFDTAPSSEDSVKYINTRIEKGSLVVCSYANYVYFLTPDTDTESLLDDASKDRSHMGNLLFLHGGLLLFWLGMMCYNIVQWLNFTAAEYTSTAPDDFIHKITIDLTGVFGNYKTTPYISLYLMLALICTPFAVYYLDAYLGAKKNERAIKRSLNHE